MTRREQNTITFEGRLETWTRECVRTWGSASEAFPIDLGTFSIEEQREKEDQIEHTFQRILHESGPKVVMTSAEKAALRDRMRGMLLRSLTGAGQEDVALFFKECEQTAREFVRTANAFDSTLPLEEVHQALRNEWVINSLQRVLRHPVTMTPSSFAYSMLYPYTDNLLDRNQSGPDMDRLFLRWLSNRLEGAAPVPRNEFAPIDRLILMIEEDYDRSAFPLVYESLLSIHRAQERGLLLRTGMLHASEADMLAITCMKGGCSVLVDGALVRGELDDLNARGVFIYGVVLQLIDDLQDFEEDTLSGHSTAFIRHSKKGVLDGIVNRLLNYVTTMMQGAFPNVGDGASSIIDLISQSCKYLVLESIARQQHLFSPEYIRHIRPFMPLDIKYLASAKEKLTALTTRIQPHASSIIRVA